MAIWDMLGVDSISLAPFHIHPVLAQYSSHFDLYSFRYFLLLFEISIFEFTLYLEVRFFLWIIYWKVNFI